MTRLRIPAIAITNDEDIIQQVLNGDYIVVFGLLECLLSATVWRGIFKCESFTEKFIGVAINEAHCITQLKMFSFAAFDAAVIYVGYSNHSSLTYSLMV